MHVCVIFQKGFPVFVIPLMHHYHPQLSVSHCTFLFNDVVRPLQQLSLQSSEAV